MTTYVNKKRRQDHNTLERAGTNKPVEMGAIWSAPALPGPRHPADLQNDVLHLGHFIVNPTQAAGAIASREVSVGSLFADLPLRRREGQP